MASNVFAATARSVVQTRPAHRYGKYHISINLGVSSAFVTIIILMTVALCAFIFLTLRGILREDLRKQMNDTIHVAALTVNGDLHETLTDPDQETSDEYLTVQRELQAIKGRVADARFVYTMTLDQSGKPVFVVDAETDDATKSHLGDVYDEPTETLLKALNSKTVGETFVEREPSPDEWGVWLSGFTVLGDSAGKAVGVLGMDVSASTIVMYEGQALATLVAVSIIVCLVVIVVGVLISRRITTPLKALEGDMAQIQRFQIDEEVHVKSVFTEIRTMSDAIWNMKTSLRAFKRYVPAELVAELITDHREAVLGGERRDLTILFSDIEGFTTWSEKLPPEQLIQLMARYFSGMSEIIMKNRGNVDKYIGDAVMAFWGAPKELDGHAVYATRAALECQEFQHRFNKELEAEGYPIINTRIGLNTGEVLVGNVGYENRLNYTVIGDHVNLASRLEGLNKLYGTRIIVSEFTRNRLGSAFLLRPLDCVIVKGKTEQIRVYEVLGHNEASADREKLARNCARGFERYLARDWPGAIVEYENALAIDPADQPARVMIDRCRQYILKDPGNDWRGAITLREK